jgi:hypothetical protein
MKIDLTNTTFIIPIRIDSEDRRRNINLVVSYLLTNFDTKIIIKESSSEQKFNSEKIISLVGQDTINKNLTYIYEENHDHFFHRTKILNDMIMMCDTDVVVNYDTDIILPLSSYTNAVELLQENYDVVYPYGYGIYQNAVFLNDQDEERLIGSSFDYTTLLEADYKTHHAAFGFCVFFNKKSYLDGFLENENFISYGPEDSERYDRFQKLGYNIGRINDIVFHLEHSRGNDSNSSNPFFIKNHEIYDMLRSMDKDSVINYYKEQEYYKNRCNKVVDNITINSVFDKVYCINLDKRTDRWESAQTEFEKNGIIVERVSAIEGGANGLLETNKKIFQDAIENNYESILILEDDVEFIDNLQEKFSDAYPNVPQHWNMLYFGGNHVFGQPVPINDYVSVPQKTLASHAIAYKKNAYQKMLDILITNEPVDVIFSNNLIYFNAFLFFPHLAWQKPGHSDIMNYYVNYDFLR